MGKRFVARMALALGISGCCFGGLPTAPGTGATGTTGTGTTGTTGTSGLGPTTGGGQFTLGPGFVPDPQTASGLAGGPVTANTMNPECRGYIASQPNHILNATGQFMNLRILAASSADLTLVVQRADGSFVCNDDSPGGGLQPEINGIFGPGQHRIWVGTYSTAAGTPPYTLGLTELPTLTHASLAGGGGIPVPMPVGALIPQECGMSTPTYGPIQVGSSVTLGAHTPYNGVGPDGQVITGDDVINWAADMQRYVGMRTTVTAQSGIDNAGCPMVQVAADNGQFYWRIRNMTL